MRSVVIRQVQNYINEAVMKKIHSLIIVLLTQTLILLSAWNEICYSQRLHPTTGCFLGVSVGTPLDANQKNYVSYKDLYHGTGQKIVINNIFVGFPSRWNGPLAFDAFPDSIVQDVLSTNPNAIMMFTLEPWERFSDFYLSWKTGNPAYEATQEFAKACKRYAKKVFIRFAHEMNGNWYHWGRDSVSSANYVTAFRNVSTVFHEVCDSVAIIWCPNYASDSTFRKYSEWWPCDEYVDWVGLDYYNWIDSKGQHTDDYQFRNALRKNGFYDEFCSDANPTGHRKPLMICETSAEFRPIRLLDSLNVIDDFENMNIGDTAQFDWWKPSPDDGSFVVTQIEDDPISGKSVMKMSGTTKTNSNYIGGIGRGIDWSENGADWSSTTGISLWLKRSKDDNANPIIRITFLDRTRHYEAGNNDGGWYEIMLDTCETVWREHVIPFASFTDTLNMTLSQICSMKIHLKVRPGETKNPSDVFIDFMQRGAVTPVVNNSDNLSFKGEWMDQLLSIHHNNSDPPLYASIGEEFRNLHAVCWFNLEKSEGCTVKDFRIPEELWNYFQQATADEYFLSGREPIDFLSSKVEIMDRISIDACFPNPFKKNITLICSVSNPTTGTVTIYDVLGRLVETKEVIFCCKEGNIFEVDGTNYPSGLYMCVVAVAGERDTNKIYYKVIKL